MSHLESRDARFSMVRLGQVAEVVAVNRGVVVWLGKTYGRIMSYVCLYGWSFCKMPPVLGRNEATRLRVNGVAGGRRSQRSNSPEGRRRYVRRRSRSSNSATPRVNPNADLSQPKYWLTQCHILADSLGPDVSQPQHVFESAKEWADSSPLRS